jgi:methylated-DNA-[protein]-cysteine S-methyltransferase
MQEAPEQRLEAVDAPGERLRVLVPSPIGALGVELLQRVVTRVLVEPTEPMRSGFTPLHRLDVSDALDEILGRLSEYFAGARRKLEVQFDVGPSGLTVFARRVLREVAKIPYGKTRTYEGIADLSGRPAAHLQVVSILLENPIPILIPCHRVVGGSDGIGSYVGGSERKLWLLRLESQSGGLL